MIQRHLFHFLQSLNLFNLLHFKFSEIFYRWNLFLLWRIKWYKLCTCIEISFVWCLEQIFSLSTKICWGLFSLDINTFCWGVFCWTRIIGFLWIVSISYGFFKVLFHGLLIFFVKVIFSNWCVQLLLHLLCSLCCCLFEYINMKKLSFCFRTLSLTSGIKAS